jgi:ADP-ribosyl-[dinitrogen reductase] hydrolase
MRARGCVLGAFVGDAAGAYLEFANKINQEEVEKAMMLKGGGKLNVGPG